MSATHVKGLTGLRTALRRDLKGLNRAVLSSAATACREGVRIVKRGLPRGDRLKRGIESEKTDTGARLVSNAPWSLPYEIGSRPHEVPFEVLLEWATERGFANPGAVAKSVQKKIAAVGTTPHWFIRNALPEIQAVFERTLAAKMKST